MAVVQSRYGPPQRWKTDKVKPIDNKGDQFDVHLLSGKVEIKVTDKLGTTADITYDSSGKFAVFLGGSSGGLFATVEDAVDRAADMCVLARTRLTEAEARRLMEAYFDEVPGY